MSNVDITLLIVEWSGQGRTEQEQMPIETSVYNQFQDVLIDALDRRTWWDFNGKHGHVEGELIIDDLTLYEAILKYNEGDLDNSFSKCQDYLDEDLDSLTRDCILRSADRVYELISQENAFKTVEFNLSGCGDPQTFFNRLDILCDKMNITRVDKN